jgi:hypothetical protein
LSRRADSTRSRRPARLSATEIVAAIRRWHDLYGEPPSMADWDPYRARQIGQEWRISRYDASDWPSIKSVRNHFGRLSDAVAAAGLVPRYQGQQRAHEDVVLSEDIMLHLAYLRTLNDRRAAGASLADAVREVSRARDSVEPDDLRTALVALAATALAWAQSVHAPTRDSATRRSRVFAGT